MANTILHKSLLNTKKIIEHSTTHDMKEESNNLLNKKDEFETEPIHDEIIHTHTSKKKKKRSKKKKKSKENKVKMDDPIKDKKTIDSNKGIKSLKKVSFSEVSIREHSRCLGEDVVPFDGGWPLGLSHNIIREYNFVGGVQEYERIKQIKLKKRWERAFGITSDENKFDDGQIITSFETRQYDYKTKNKNVETNNNHRRRSTSFSGEDDLNDGKNPLFKPSDEGDRKKLILRDYAVTVEDVEKDIFIDVHAENIEHEEHKHKHKKDSKSLRRSTRYKSENSEYEGTPFSAYEIRHIRNDLEQIRNQRSLKSTGCSCRKPNFYLPFYNQSIEICTTNTSSKHKGTKLSDRRLKEELRRRGKFKTDQSRPQLEIELGKAIEVEPCCWSNDCECVRNNIPCQADSCSCWQPQHQANSTSTPEDIKKNCGNKYGMYVVDIDDIRRHRQRLIDMNPTGIST